MNPHIEYTPSKFEMKMFQEMEGKYVSENEKVFFETMRRKIQTECASLRREQSQLQTGLRNPIRTN